MNRTVSFFSIFLFACCFLSCATTQQVVVPPETIDALFQGYSQPNAPGASLLVVRDGVVLHRRTYGLAHLEERRLVSSATNFRLASVTKQFTAMAVLMLAERKLLSLDDPLAKFFPDIAASYRDIKIRQILNHTSGVVDYESLMPDSQTVQVLDRDVLELLNKADTVYFPAGSKFQYSNSGYALLALLVEKVSHQSFAEFLKQNIFQPLEMNNTVAREANTVVANRAYGFTRASPANGAIAEFTFADQSNTSAVLGDGGIYSSTDDLYTWDQALYTERLVYRATLEQAMSPSTPTDTAAYWYGFGWYIGKHRGMKTVFHTGSSRGFRNAIIRLPEQRFSVIILTNRNEGEPIEIAYKIIDRYFAE